MSNNWQEYRRLRDLVVEGRANQQELELLEQLVLQSDELKRDYASHVHLVAALRASFSETPPEIPAATDITTATEITAATGLRGESHSRSLLPSLLSLAAGIVLALGGAWYWMHRETSYATIAWSENCRWEESTLPTIEDQGLGAGHLKLRSGMATLRFPKVDVTLEGPVEIEIVNSRHCRVHSGRVLANVNEGGEGFVMETPTAQLVDRGTLFGVNVVPSGSSELTVFDGEVDVNHFVSGNKMTVRRDENIRISGSGLGPIEAALESSIDLNDSIDEPGASIQISTAIGSGDDAYVSPRPLKPESSSKTALLVKRPPNAEPGDWGEPYRRKAFLRFDLSLLGDVEIDDAKLQLHGVATKIGFASLMPDAEFSVYGLIDESQDHWSSDTITWENSPAQIGDQLDIDPSQVTLVGRFHVPQSQPTGRFEVASQRLAQFLRSDTNGLATLIIIAETVGEGAAYVHGFANKRHPDLPAPTLRIGVR